MQSLTQFLARQRALSLYRERHVVAGPQGVEITVDGRQVVAFCSNDYLGLANHPEVVAALADGARLYGAGSGASHLISGHSIAHQRLEEALAEFTGRPRALLFSTGYMANLGVPAALVGRGDTVFEDRLNHASLIDGARLSRARLRRYPHGDVAVLEAWLSRHRTGDALIASDGVFSMDGDLAPVNSLTALAGRHGAWLMIDDAHGLGIMGADGRGSITQCPSPVDDHVILIGTLGKAFGTFGAFVAGSTELIEYLIQRARTYIYTTALPPAVAHATLTSLRLVREEGWRRTHLHALITRLRTGLARFNLPLTAAPTPIQPVVVGDADRASTLSQALLQRGLLIPAIRPPTVPKGGARLRITLSAAHQSGHVDRLIDELARLL
jgi:8-amino-7-oxononanoate synthase